MLSLKMVGPEKEGDGVIMASTGAYARGAVALVLGYGGTAVETHRMSTTVWATNKLMTQTDLAGILIDYIPHITTGFESFYCAQSTSPWTATAW